MEQIHIKSTNPNDTPVEIEMKLEKALTSVKLQREHKTFNDAFLRQRKKVLDTAVNAVMNNMIKEIMNVLK